MLVSFVIYKLILIVAVLGIALFIATYSTYAERKLAAFMQDRIGPNRAGPAGIFQPFADAVKFFFKEEFTPAQADKFLFYLAPCLAMFTACLTGAVIPWGKEITLFGNTYPLQIADLNIGILYATGVVSVGVYGIMLGGWASNNKFALLGAIRASSQMISYEIGMGLAIIAIIMLTGSLSLREIAEQQQGGNWNIFYQPLGFIIFITCSFAECNRTPFDLPECEQELVGGYHTEYSSMKLGLFLFAEYINMFISSAMISTLYFGGYDFPFINKLGLPPNLLTLIGTGILFAKILFFIFFFMWIRWTIPRFRYDQLMHLGWKVLMPLGILNLFITGLASLLKDKVF